MAIFKVDAEVREDVGKGASRRLRHAGLVPVVLYGGDRDPRNLTISHNKVLRLIEDEAFFSSIIEFSADGGKKQKVVLKDYTNSNPGFSMFVGPFLTWRESKALHRLQGLCA